MDRRIETGVERFPIATWVDATGSTNDDLLGRADEGEAEGAVLATDLQIRGRGRLDRRWESPAGASLMFSLLLRPDLPPDRLGSVTAAAGLAIAESTRQLVGPRVALKWPNDLVAWVDGDTRKLCGILAEARGGAVVVGAGVNCAPIEAVDPGLAGTALGLEDLGSGTVDREALLLAIVGRFDHWYGAIETPAGRRSLWSLYRAMSATIGSEVRVDLAERTVVGRAVDIDDHGHLLVAEPGATGATVVTTGDVVHLRPA